MSLLKKLQLLVCGLLLAGQAGIADEGMWLFNDLPVALLDRKSTRLNSSH